MKKVLKNNEKSFKLTTLGFTLIELLGVLIILAIIALITFPIIDNVLTNSRQQAYERSIDGIIEASKMYVTSQGLIPSTTTKQLSLQTLINSGFLEDKDIIDPRNNENMTGCVLYSWNNSTNQYIFEYSDECIIYTSEQCFIFDSSTGTITGYEVACGGTSISIPPTIDGVNVKIIGEGAFRYSDLVDVLFPNSIEIIEEEAFRYNYLTTVDLTKLSNLLSIGPQAFASNCSHTYNLPHVLLPSYYTGIDGTQYNC